MKKLKLLFASLVLFTSMGAAIFPYATSAVTDPFKRSCDITSDKDSEFCQNVDEGSRPFVFGSNSLLVTIAQLVVFITAAVSVVMIVIGGFKYVSSGGDTNGTKSAKDTILYAVVGLIVAISAQIIVSFVLTKLVN